MIQARSQNNGGGRFCFPSDLFDDDGPGHSTQWTCVYTRPRWEKKLAEWLAANRRPYYLPTFPRRTTSHRRTRVHALPLFPGYLFVQGEPTKGELRDSKAVITMIRPDNEHEADQLHRDIWSVWRTLSTGSHLELTPRLKVGQWVEVVSGPLKGVRGTFEKWIKGNRMIIGIDMLKVGVTVEVPDTCVVVPID